MSFDHFLTSILHGQSPWPKNTCRVSRFQLRLWGRDSLLARPSAQRLAARPWGAQRGWAPPRDHGEFRPEIRPEILELKAWNRGEIPKIMGKSRIKRGFHRTIKAVIIYKWGIQITNHKRSWEIANQTLTPPEYGTFSSTWAFKRHTRELSLLGSWYFLVPSQCVQVGLNDKCKQENGDWTWLNMIEHQKRWCSKMELGPNWPLHQQRNGL